MPTKKEIEMLNNVFNSFPKRSTEFVLHLDKETYKLCTTEFESVDKINQAFLKARLKRKHNKNQ